ncbi:dendritic arbor reduction protein 1 [Drosophila miranda]|uniref:dendritic arbor reduction protein 1 n=1 Tax=Drosophila miranda TaxID=7229 RepID=UPI0007E7AE57|nr:dendritic arbor reduction protein 1 [Drosophila miranda]
MWKMLDIMDMPSSDADIFMFECDDCAGGMLPMPLAPPPQFLIPPPPRPPALAEYTVVPQDCNDEQLAQQQWDSDVCQAMPILDASLYSSQSLATSAMIAVFSLLLVLIVLISSLFVWKNKRKVQNLLPCKTPTRGGPLTGAMPLGGGGTLGSAHHHHHHHGLYEDPDAHLGHHRPLVMHRHHHHHQHHQQLPHHHHHHYQQHHSELLQGKSIHYPSGYPMTRSPPFLVSSSPGPDPYRSNDNVYEELGPGRVDSDGESEPPLHSDDDFAEDELSLPGECSFQKESPAAGAGAGPVAAANSPAAPGATPYHERAGGSGTQGLLQQAPQERHSVLSSGSSTGQDASTATASSGSGSGNNNNNNELLLARRTPRTRQPRSNPAAQDQDLNNSSSTAEIADLAPLYDNRSNLMSLGYMARSTAPQFYNTLEHEVERRNRINAQLSKAPVPPLSTIYRERIRYPAANQQYPSNSASGLMAATMRARTQPRIVDRRLAAHQHQHHRIHAAPLHQEPAYGYAEPMYNANYYYESAANQQARAVPFATSTGDYRHPYGDSSFGSDSGYSHHTPASSIGRQDYDLAEPQLQQLQQPKQPSKLSSALSFGWNRGRGKATPMMVVAATATASSSSSAEATSPNNNSSACSTVTSQLENNNPAAASLSPA